jgi:hypothetical protein
VSAAGRGTTSRRPGRRRASEQRPPELVRLVGRMIMAQAGLSTAIGLAYSRRHLPSILITLMLLAALCGLAAATRSGTHAAWTIAIASESAFIAFGLFRFITSRYLGGTLLGVIACGVLLHPVVARAFTASSWRAEAGYAEPAMGEASQP